MNGRTYEIVILPITYDKDGYILKPKPICELREIDTGSYSSSDRFDYMNDCTLRNIVYDAWYRFKKKLKKARSRDHTHSEEKRAEDVLSAEEMSNMLLHALDSVLKHYSPNDQKS